MMISVIVVLAVCAILLLIRYAYGRIALSKSKSTALAPASMPGPGQSLKKRLDVLNTRARIDLVSVIISPFCFLSAHILTSYFGDLPESWGRTLVAVGGGSLLTGFLLWRWAAVSMRRRSCGLRLEGEMAVAEALEMLVQDGYQIFHDFPADSSNVGHIVIGPAGVMVVETWAGSLAHGRGRKGDAVVTYDGRMLHFPRFSDHQTVDHAKHQAVWLSNWLSDAVQQPIIVRAMVAIPHWHVKRTSATGIPVVNPSQFPTLFEHITPRPLTEDVLQRVGQCIMQRYTDTSEDMADVRSQN